MMSVSRLARGVSLASLLAAIAAVLSIVLSSTSSTHTLRLVFAQALQVVPGEKVEIAGRQVGSVQSASLSDGAALVVIDVDDSAWPLHAGTFARLRYGSPLGYALRYVELDPGPNRAPTLPDGGILSEANTATPVEFDDVARIWNRQTRAYLGELFDNGDATLHGEGPQLANVLRLGGPATEQIAGFESDIAQDPAAFNLLLQAGAATASQLDRHDAQLQALVTDAADTLGVMTSQAQAIQSSISDAPPALDASRATLAHLDTVLGALRTVIDDIRPGALQLRENAPVLSQATATLSQVAPRLTTALQTAYQLAPVITRFFNDSSRSLPSTSEMVGTLAPMLGCLRPYAPEIAGALVETDSADAAYDSGGHFIRDAYVSSPIALGNSNTPAQLMASYPYLKYAFPRPPGWNVGQPWFQPQCAAGPAGLNPADDKDDTK
jgi:ABC-type transporter Mla subunit MlaD